MSRVRSIIAVRSYCSECGVLSIGTYLKTYTTYRANIDKLAVHPFFRCCAPTLSMQCTRSAYCSSKHNMGLALDRRAWNIIRNCSSTFCTYDDYNWDWSLMPIAVKCFNPRLQVLYTKSPRVFHIGDWCARGRCK